MLCAADSKGRPLFHLVCYASETHLKGALVRFAAEVMQVRARVRICVCVCVCVCVLALSF